MSAFDGGPIGGNGFMIGIALGAALLAAGTVTGEEMIRSIGMAFSIVGGLGAFVDLF